VKITKPPERRWTAILRRSIIVSRLAAYLSSINGFNNHFRKRSPWGWDWVAE
jgi:hypothetical protein